MNSLYGVHKRMVATALQPNLPGTSRNPNTTSTANAAQSWNPGTQPTVVESQRISDLQEQFQQQAQKDPAGFRLALREAFGDKADLSQLDLLLDLALAGKLPMPANIRFVEAGSLGSNAFGAYDSSNGGSLYLDRSLLSDPAKLQSVFNEEMGHHLDALLGDADAAGDEGEVFSRTLEQGQLSQSELASLKNENDHGVIQLEGRWVQVEFNEEDSDDGGDGGDGGGGGECSVGGEGNAGAGGSQTSDNEDGGTGGTGGECNVDGPPSGGDGPPGGDNRDDEKDDKPSSGNGPQGGDGPPGVDNGDDDSDEMQTGDGFDNEAASEAMGDVQTGFDALGDTQEELGDLPNDPIPDDRTGFAKAARGLGFMAGTLSSLFDFRDGYQDRKKEGGSTSDAIFAGTASVVKTVDDIAVSAAGGWAGAARGGAYGASAGAATGTPHGTAIGGAIGTVGGGLVGGYVAGAAYDDSPIDEAIDADVDAKFDRIAENFNAGYDEGKAE